MRLKLPKITESVIPVILLLSGIFFLLLFVQFRASEDAEQAQRIHITAQTSAQNIPEKEKHSVVEEDFSDDPRIVEAQKMIKKGMLAEAESIYFGILAKKPSAQIHNWLGMLYLKEEKYNKAVVSFSNALKINKMYYKARYNRAIAYSALNEFDKAVADYKGVISTFETHAKSHFNLGLLYYNHQDYLAAQQEFERTAALSTGDIKVKALNMLGQCYVNMTPPNNDEAVAAFTAAVRLKPNHIASRLSLIDLEYPKDKEGYVKRLEALERLLTLEPENIEIYRAMSEVYLLQNNTTLALRQLQKARLHEPDNIDLQFEVVALLMRVKQDQEAIATLESILTVDPASSKVYFLLGELYTRQDAYEAAMESYNKVLLLKKEGSAELWNSMGLLFMKLERFDEAESAFKKALVMQSEYAEVYYNLGVLSLMKKSLDKAERYFEKAIELRPAFQAAYTKLATLFTEKGQTKKAVDAYLKVLAINPEQADVKLDLGVCYTKLKEYKKAQALYEEILEKESGYFSAWLNLGDVYYRLKEYDRSLEALEKAMLLDPEEEKVYRLFARNYSAMKKHDKAIKILNQLLEQNPSDIETRLAYARSFYKANKIDIARSEY
ncbi:MAG: tetratricopeptide repeat protein, partial [Sulfurimonadaceae bacterium]